MKRPGALESAALTGGTLAVIIAVFAAPVHITLTTPRVAPAHVQPYHGARAQWQGDWYAPYLAYRAQINREVQQVRQQQDAGIRQSITPMCEEGSFAPLPVSQVRYICREWHLPVGS